MRILVVGAGGIGGYVGGRLLAAGRDVTFLVRPARAQKLKETGLVIRSPAGDLEWPNPPTVTADGLKTQFDLVILSGMAQSANRNSRRTEDSVRSGDTEL
jgi:2-dehydropantoate 2-reductase